MKKNDIIILTSVATYTYLFYHQNAGINFLIFSVLLILALLLQDKSLIRNRHWLGAALGTLFSGTAILLYSNSLSIITNILSLSLLASFSLHQTSSLIIAGLHSLYTYLSSIPYFFFRSSERLRENKTSGNIGIRILIVIVPVIITLVFFAIYRAANPVFKAYTDKLNLDFISWEWVRFVALGWILLYAFFNQVYIASLKDKDEAGNDNLESDSFTTSIETARTQYENLSGIILFALLNLLLLSVNIIDVSLWISPSLPEGMTYAEYVHQGVGLLIVSILIAISIILFYFRGTLNFYKSSRSIRFLAYIWIIQNALLIITTAFKNQIYIEEYSLTYKRIGVYVYLLLSFIGLITTFLKIYLVKSNWFLFRKNAWSFYVVLIASCFINWDRLIAQYNITYSKNLDKEYLLNLSESVLPDVLEVEQTGVPTSFTEVGEEVPLRRKLHISVYNFFKRESESGWQSWDYEDDRIKSNLSSVQQTKLRSLDLSGNIIESLQPVYGLKELQNLNLEHTYFKNFQELRNFNKLQRLDLSNNSLDSLTGFPALSSLKFLDLSENRMQDLLPIHNCSNIQELDLSNSFVKIQQFPKLPDLKSLNLFQSVMEDMTQLRGLNKLEKLQLNHIHKSNLYALPVFKNLKILELSQIELNNGDLSILEKIAGMPQLQKLNLAHNALSNTAFLESWKGHAIDDLDLSYNTINSLTGIEQLSKLRILHLDHCKLKSADALAASASLEELHLTGNNFPAEYLLPEMASLKVLDLSGNSLGSLKILANQTKIESINLAQTGISDITMLKKFNNLKQLNISDNPISDVSPLLALEELEALTMNLQDKGKIETLTKLKKLKQLTCYSNSEEDLKELQKALPHVRVNTIYTPELVAPDRTPAEAF